MVCNSSVQRFGVRVKVVQGDLGVFQHTVGNGYVYIPGITAVAGLSLGTVGSVTLHERRGQIEIPDDTIKFDKLGISKRLEPGVGALANGFFQAWWENRKTVVCDVTVDILTKSMCFIYGYKFEGVTYESKKDVDRALGEVKVGEEISTFFVYDVRVISPANFA